jgi:8-oxo-dGTP diphosphatase
MTTVNLRHSARAVILDQDDRIMLCRFAAPHQEVVAPGHAEGYDGVANDYFLVRTTSFGPRGALSAVELTAEHISGFHWWRCQDITGYRGTGLFSPRDLATPLTALLANGIPDTPVLLGL